MLKVAIIRDSVSGATVELRLPKTNRQINLLALTGTETIHGVAWYRYIAPYVQFGDGISGKFTRSIMMAM